MFGKLKKLMKYEKSSPLNSSNAVYEDLRTKSKSKLKTKKGSCCPAFASCCGCLSCGHHGGCNNDYGHSDGCYTDGCDDNCCDNSCCGCC